MKIYNSLTDKLEEFKPLKEGQVSMYVCGPTVYNYVHIGNMRPVITFDMIRNYLEYLARLVKGKIITVDEACDLLDIASQKMQAL